METKLAVQESMGEVIESQANKMFGLEEENNFLRRNVEILLRENEALEKYGDQRILLQLLEYIKNGGGVIEAASQEELKVLRRKLEIANNRVEVTFNRIDAMNTQLEVAKAETTHLRNEIDNCHRIISDKDNMIHSLLHSSSWKLTSPLRAIFNKLRGR
ncbi:hypothetical protein L2089_19230 [Paenibacillus hunanensis]|uniref:hypothetical protein n=1 Tax=Paenibacillus hunanensis TaxID=539262 RepID=UPI0020260FDB|nr:hypothetical protein [Paenibacillus hunanensis]MCL9662826.1 hypothetical protein [Paenibacillus hunanensis]